MNAESGIKSADKVHTRQHSFPFSALPSAAAVTRQNNSVNNPFVLAASSSAQSDVVEHSRSSVHHNAVDQPWHSAPLMSSDAEGGGALFLRWETLTPAALFASYTEHLAWSLFLTSTAIHAVLLITSPVQAVYKWYRRQSSDSDTPLPYLCAVIGSLLWLRYSVFIQDGKLVLLQSYAVLMQTFFLFAMLFYRSKKCNFKRRLLRAIMAVFTGIALLFLFISQLPPQMGLQFTGVCASGAQILGSFVCPYLIYKAISSKFIDFIPFAPVAFTWIMELHAIVYSVGVNDIYLLTANSVFFTMDGLLLSMFFIYPNERTPAAVKEHNKMVTKVNML